MSHPESLVDNDFGDDIRSGDEAARGFQRRFEKDTPKAFSRCSPGLSSR
ncbi:hypothetical protein NRB20_51680 [Nocardia sp. RB20]|uniref:Uncharacterized protein n=1 Tax=Nocardia macrotermitis TaxID=2585198 RepID=A0A7K0D8D6_9NOCA|nr:hypothetical protein [Nocardia macrotermitis]